MDDQIAKIATDQHGVFTRKQARDLGFSRAQIALRVERNRWVEITKDIFRIAGTSVSDRSTVMATVFSAGPDAVTTASSALSLHGVRDFHLLPAAVAASRRPHTNAMAGVVETFKLPETHRTTIDNIPCATVARALFDLSGDVGERTLARAVDAALAARKVTVAEILQVIDDVAERGRRGSPRLRAVVDERAEGYQPPTTRLEVRFLELVLQAGIGAPERQVSLGGRLGWIGAVDFAWPDARVIVETDGDTYHNSLTDRENDERRDRALEAQGWIVLRFNWIDVTKRPTSVIQTLRNALALAA